MKRKRVPEIPFRERVRDPIEKILLGGLLLFAAVLFVLVTSGDEFASLRDLPDGFGRVEITKSPPEATVILYDPVGDQNYVNRENPAVFDVVSGTYKIEITAERYIGQIHQVNVTSAKITRISVKLEPGEKLKQEQKEQGGLVILVAIILTPIVIFIGYFSAVRMIEDRRIG